MPITFIYLPKIYACLLYIYFIHMHTYKYTFKYLCIHIGKVLDSRLNKILK